MRRKAPGRIRASHATRSRRPVFTLGIWEAVLAFGNIMSNTFLTQEEQRYTLAHDMEAPEMNTWIV